MGADGRFYNYKKEGTEQIVARSEAEVQAVLRERATLVHGLGAGGNHAQQPAAAASGGGGGGGGEGGGGGRGGGELRGKIGNTLTLTLSLTLTLTLTLALTLTLTLALALTLTLRERWTVLANRTPPGLFKTTSSPAVNECCAHACGFVGAMREEAW